MVRWWYHGVNWVVFVVTWVDVYQKLPQKEPQKLIPTKQDAQCEKKEKIQVPLVLKTSALYAVRPWLQTDASPPVQIHDLF